MLAFFSYSHILSFSRSLSLQYLLLWRWRERDWRGRDVLKGYSEGVVGGAFDTLECAVERMRGE